MKAALFVALMLVPVPALAQRAELPVREVDLPNGDRRFAVNLIIDGQAEDVGIDTGSTGLRVLPRGLGPGGQVARGPQVAYSFGAGTAFKGSMIAVPVAVGAVAGPIRIMRVDTIGCLSTKAACPASRLDPARFGIQGDGLPGQGFSAILGIRLTRDAVANPFEQLGVRRWIVELPTPGGAPGRIVLNPTDAEVAGYPPVPVDGEGTTAGCLEGPETICGSALLDTGAAGLRVIRAKPFSPWPDGTPATVTIGGGSAAQPLALTIGRRDQASALLYAPGDRTTQLSFGFAPFFHWSVLFDAEHREIGLKAR